MRISVCMATYNGANYVKEQLESILFQLGDDDEIVISDDGSSDNTLAIIENLNDPRIFIVNNSGMKGVVSNFNNALSYAKGDYIFLSDQDDIWLKDRVSRTLYFLKDYDLVVSNCSVINQNEVKIIDSYFDVANSRKGFIKNIISSSYLGCGLAFNRDVFNYCMPIPLNLMMYHDWWIGVIADLKFMVFFDSKPTFLYRRHQNTASRTVNIDGSKRTTLMKVVSRVQLLFKAIERIIRKKYDI